MLSNDSYILVGSYCIFIINYRQKSYKQFLWLYSTHKYSIMAPLTRRRSWPTNKHSLPGISLTQETLIFEDSVVENKMYRATSCEEQNFEKVETSAVRRRECNLHLSL